MVRGQQASSTGVRERFQLFTPLGVAKWIVAQAGFLALVFGLIYRWRGDPRRRAHLYFLVLSLLAFLLLGFSSIRSATGAHVWAFGCLIASLLVIANESWERRALGAWLIIFAIAVFGHDHIAVEDCLADKPLSPEKRAALLAEIAQLQPRRLYLDPYAMRELYDYRLPANAFDFEFSSTTGWDPPGNPQTLPPDSVSVVSVKIAFPTRLSPDAGKQGRPLKIFGHPIGGMFQNPYDLEIMDNRF
jgi:hypothetical protein